MERRRFQQGSRQLRRRERGKKWVVLYYDDAGHRRYPRSVAVRMTKTAAGCCG